MKAGTLSIVTIFAMAVTVLGAETREFVGDTTQGWFVWNVSTGKQENENLNASEGWLRFKYNRAQFAMLGHLMPVTGLKTLTVEIKSDADALIAFGVEDTDKAKFHYPVQLKAGETKTITIKPEDFKLNNDSPTRKEKVEPEKLGQGYLIADLSFLTGATGDNTLHIRKVTIVRETESKPEP